MSYDGTGKTAYEEQQEKRGSGTVGDVVDTLEEKADDMNPLKLLTGQRETI